MKARQIIDLLAEKHGKDVFVSECKNGPTWGGTHIRLDGWAMKRSWANPVTYGYEIKISRQDFLKDDKWPSYLDYCSEFYFVCTHGLIQPEELPNDVGLLWVAKTGTRLFTKRKAVRRDVQIPEALFRYVLMSRASINGYDLLNGTDVGQRAYWERWLKNKKIDLEFGWKLGKTIRETVEKRIYDVEKENERLKRRYAGYDSVRQAMERLGLDPEHPNSWEVDRKFREAEEGVPQDLRISISNTINSLQKLDAHLENLKARKKT